VRQGKTASEDEQLRVFGVALKQFGISDRNADLDVQVLRALFANKEILHAIDWALKRQSLRKAKKISPRKRGPKPKQTPLKKRTIARHFRKYRDSRPPRLSREQLLEGFLKSLPSRLASRANISRDGGKQISPGRLGNMISEGESLLDQGLLWLQLKRIIRNHPAAHGTRPLPHPMRRGILTGEVPTDELIEEIERARVSKLLATRVLLGDRWRESFIAVPGK